MKKNTGFTLIELMITLAVAAILATVAIPSFTSMIKNNRLTAQANQFVVAMNYARSEAIKRAESIDVTANTGGWSNGWTISVASNGSVLRVFAPLDAVTLTSVGNITTYQYQSNGMVSGADTLHLCDDRTGETGRTISLLGTGRISVSNYTCS